MRQVFHVIDVGHVDRNLVALFDVEAVEREGRRGRIHVDAHLVAVANDFRVGFQVDAILLRLLTGILEERIVALPD